jgi:hypothetical protein
MKKFTIILLYPDYLDDFPQTWGGHVEADNLIDAIMRAQIKCAESYRIEEENDRLHPGDLYPLAIFAGEHMDLIGEWAAQCSMKHDAEPLDQAA